MPAQDSIDILISHFNQMIALSKNEKDLVKAKFHHRLYRKRQYVLQEGDICTNMNFVVRGCLRMYKIDDQGNTHILHFAGRDAFIYSGIRIALQFNNGKESNI